MFIEKRKQGKNTKYFLVHSFRERGSVVKLRRYLGSNLSAEQLTHKKKEAELHIREQLQYYRQIRNPLSHVLRPEELQQIKELQEKYPAGYHTWDDTAWQRFSELFSYNTNAIEGSTVTLNEVKGLKKGQIPDKPPLDIAEAKNVMEAVRYLRKVREHVSIDFIKKLHAIVFKDSKPFAGTFRPRGVEVIIRNTLGVVVHRGAPSEQVVSLLNALIHWYKKHRSAYPPLLLAAIIHNEFERIHPFQDGNGRVGRLLLNNILIKHHLPPVNIEFKNRQLYYATLRAYDGGDVRPTIELILKEYKKLRRI